ncbi:glycosyltransferase family 4 protein [Sphingomonas sp. LR60]|uniref:glycosyltransferase family 4 protein n=1 Tax=Sphingomonas sp. LR60 TaxID=3050233 RepID=UPI002FE1B5A3
MTRHGAASPPVMIVTCEYPPFPGGIGTYAGEMARAGVDAGAAVSVIAPRYEGIPGELPAGVRHHLVLRHHKIPPAAILQVLRLVRGAPADTLLLAADVRTVLLLKLLQPLHRRAYRVMVHGSEAAKFKPGSILFKLIQKAYLGADLVAYNSRATGDIFRAQLGTPKHEAITYLGVDRQWFDPAERDAFEHPELADLPADAPVFCSVGRLEARKGQVETIQALARARDQYGLADPVYVVVGRTEDEAYERAIVAEAAERRVRTLLPGRLSISDIKLLYQRAAAHLLFARELPGKIEGFGLVLIEAGAQGCPSITTAVGGIPEVLGDTGAVVPADDVDRFAAQVASYGSDAALSSTQGALVRERASTFTWKRCFAETFPEAAHAK